MGTSFVHLKLTRRKYMSDLLSADEINIITLTEKYGKLVDPKYIPVKDKVCEECTDCCSDMVPFTMEEINKFTELRPDLAYNKELEYVMDGTSAYLRNDGKCAFLVDGRCAVYEDRPDICRAYGASPLAQCGMEGIGYTPTAPERAELSKPAHQKSSENMMNVFFMALKEKQEEERKRIC